MYGVSAVLLVIGIALSLTLVFQLLGGSEKDLRFVAPGSKEFTVDKEGTYTIFYEHKSVVDGKVYLTDENIPGLLVLVQEKQSEDPVKLVKSTNSSYNLNGREGVSLFKFKIEKPGTYDLLAAYEDVDGPKIVLSVKRDFVQSLLLGIGGTLIGVGFTLASIILFIVTYLKRK